ncbi:hypothetical protein EZS27_020515 [termite gut metagenome]|uniref:Baseplate protein J-like domain-containing protein n=1 Tax=termite gut metagenome TaxID=433724 RepID=A0A5J4R9T3_9ZZZZ
MSKQISNLARTYEDYRNEFQRLTKEYYPELIDSFDDASVGSWFVDILSAGLDELSYHLDRVHQETDINSANEYNSKLSIARTNNIKIPGKKAAMVEVELSCEIPVDGSPELRMPDETYCPVIKKGTLLSNGLVTFELIEDVNFAEQFNENGISNRQIIPKRNANGNVEKYTYKKLSIALAGQSKIFKRTITDNDITPFLSIILQDKNVLSIESIIFKDGMDFTTDPLISDFFVDSENYTPNSSTQQIFRYFEVENLAQQYLFLDSLKADSTPQSQYITVDAKTTAGVFPVNVGQIYKGEWKFIKQKFITEYTPNGQLQIVFGAGGNVEIPLGSNYAQYQMSKLISNEFLGLLPRAGWTMFILYRVGGGEISNIAAGSLNTITYLNLFIGGNSNDSNCSSKVRSVKDSIKVTNVTPSFGGKDALSVEELTYFIKYNNAAQNRCVTVDDYIGRIMQMPSRYGIPFKFSVAEENNKITSYFLGLNEDRTLNKVLPSMLTANVKEYLKKYRNMNDFIEIRSGRVINISFLIDLFIDKAYDKYEITRIVMDKVYDYMDINKHRMNQDVFLGDLSREISNVDGVINLIGIRVYNEYGTGYSTDRVTQELVTPSQCDVNLESEELPVEGRSEIDLKASDFTLYSDITSMFEIKYKNKDISVRIKER